MDTKQNTIFQGLESRFQHRGTSVVYIFRIKNHIFCALTILLFSIALLGCNAYTMKPLKAGDIPSGVPLKAEEKLKFLKSVDNCYSQINDRAVWRLNRLKWEADNYSIAKLSLDGVGIGCGIAAAALIVASPANAVWVAALGGVTTGVVGFQSRSAGEGFARDAALRVYDESKEKMENAANAYLVQYENLAKLTPKDDNDAEWRVAAAGAVSALLKYYNAVVFVSLPRGLPEDVEKLKRLQEDQKRIQDEQNKNIQELLKMRQQMQGGTQPKLALQPLADAIKEKTVPLGANTDFQVKVDKVEVDEAKRKLLVDVSLLGKDSKELLEKGKADPITNAQIQEALALPAVVSGTSLTKDNIEIRKRQPELALQDLADALKAQPKVSLDAIADLKVDKVEVDEAKRKLLVDVSLLGKDSKELLEKGKADPITNAQIQEALALPAVVSGTSLTKDNIEIRKRLPK